MKETPLLTMAARQMLAAGINPHEGSQALRKAMIVEALEQHRGNICRTARALEMHRNTLNRQIDELQIRDVAPECRADAANQRLLRYGGRLPASASSRKPETGDRSRVA